MEIFNKMIDVMKEGNGILSLSDCFIVMNQTGEFGRGKFASDGSINWDSIVLVNNEAILKLCDEYSAEIEQYYDQLNNINYEDSIKKAM